MERSSYFFVIDEGDSCRSGEQYR